MEDCLLSQCSETQAAVISGHVASGPSSPDTFSGPSSPDAHYSDTSPRTEDAKEHRRNGEIETGSIAANSSRGEKNSETPVLKIMAVRVCLRFPILSGWRESEQEDLRGRE